MVLHNNKWDRKAKLRYLKKHGLLDKKPETPADAENICKAEERHSDGEQVHHSDGEHHSDSDGTPEVLQQELQELEFEISPYQDHSDLIAEHIRSTKVPERRRNVQYTSNHAEFAEIEQNIAKNKLSRDIKRKFGKASYKLADEDGDDNDFWQATQPNTSSSKASATKSNVRVDVDTNKQAWLDDLIN